MNGFQIEHTKFWILLLHFSVETIDVDDFDGMFTQEVGETFLRQLDAVSELAVQLWPFVSFEDADIWGCRWIWGVPELRICEEAKAAPPDNDFRPRP
jgi:hypothetical protein